MRPSWKKGDCHAKRHPTRSTHPWRDEARCGVGMSGEFGNGEML